MNNEHPDIAIFTGDWLINLISAKICVTTVWWSLMHPAGHWKVPVKRGLPDSGRLRRPFRLVYTYKQAKEAIASWKAHQLWSIWPDRARADELIILDQMSTYHPRLGKNILPTSITNHILIGSVKEDFPGVQSRQKATKPDFGAYNWELLTGHLHGRENTTEEQRSKGRVPFVDEACWLTPFTDGVDYGCIAIDQLVSAKEQGDPVMIFVGDPKEMAEFLKANPGLNLRIKYKFVFNVYSLEELATILQGYQKWLSLQWRWIKGRPF